MIHDYDFFSKFSPEPNDVIRRLHGAKYITFENEDGLYMAIFSQLKWNHNEFAYDHKHYGQPVSAGLIYAEDYEDDVDQIAVYGESTTLMIRSNKQQDNALLRDIVKDFLEHGNALKRVNGEYVSVNESPGIKP